MGLNRWASSWLGRRLEPFWRVDAMLAVEGCKSLSVLPSGQQAKKSQGIAAEEIVDVLGREEIVVAEDLDEPIFETFEVLVALYYMPVDAKKQLFLDHDPGIGSKSLGPVPTHVLII